MSVYAQEYGYFFNSNNSDRKYNAESFETWLKPFFVSGVFTGGLQVSAQSTPDMSVQVSAGYANLDGKLGYWNESNTLTLETASGVYSRYDTIVLRRDNTNRRVSIEVVTGTASSNPQPTAPTRTADIFELVLAEILVVAGATEITASKIEDKRPDDTVCGYVVAAVQTPDFSELYAQFTAQAEEFMGEQAAEFLAWFDEMKDQLSEDAAGHLQNEIDDINNTIGDVPVGKDLQGEINDIEIEINTLEEGLAIVVDGDKTAHVGGAAIGDYVLVKNSTITDILDGGYKAAKAIPANTVIDKTYLTACSNGIANSLSDQIANIGTWTYLDTKTGNTPVDIPSNCSELLLYLHRNSGSAQDRYMVVPIVTAFLTTNAISIRTSWFAATDTRSYAEIKATSSSVYMNEFTVAGTSYLSTAEMIVYYK